jgi:hypothetical protein
MRQLSTVLRVASLLFLGVTCLATSCIEVRGIAISPGEGAPLDSALARAVALTQRLGTHHGLTPYTAPEQAHEQYALCVAHESLFVCVKTKGREVQLRSYAAPRFSAWGDSLYRELLDSLRGTFDSARVRECNWRIERSPRQSGCRTSGA